MKSFWFQSLMIRKIAWLALATVILLALDASQLPAQNESQAEATTASEGRSLDPLTPEDRSYAERIVRADKRVRELLGEAGIRVVSIEPIAVKAKSPDEAELRERTIEVVLFRPEGEVGARAVVNLQQKSVAEVEKLSSSQVPMTDDDLRDAFQLALLNSEVEKLLGADARSFQIQVASGETNPSAPENLVTGLPLRSTDPKDPCFKHRCMELYFRRGTDFLSGPIVVADLTAKRVYVTKERRKHQ